ncbi:ABC transporter permease [Motiliproteus coralliicola]|uniref:ABC transporter permease n=1 Tax=Motiliproteus coralliicola TaxID=2283196 RepID=A0A369WF23_9GAMM|nr:FtsX-like permease family protein [Motiliproteus coralliicola]RDE18065.1 ABC transporter permease [Motiliproteus coralliicola]
MSRIGRSTLTLALRLLKREWRSGELRLLLIALCIAVTAGSAVGFFTDRVERALVRQATEFLGADLVLTSAREFQLDLTSQAQQRQLQLSKQLIFPSMVMRGEEMMLSSIKAVDQQYPLKGIPKVSDSLSGAPERLAQPPAPGTAWVEPRLLDSLNLKVGDSVEVGNQRLTITKVLLQEPDRGGGLFNLRPRLMMHIDDLVKAEVIQPGSRANYRYLFNGDEATLDTFKQWLSEQMLPGQRLLDIREENPSLGNTLTRAQRYLNLSSLLAVVLAGVAIAMAARRYSERHFDTAALLRCLGQPQKGILQLFALQLLVAGLLAALVGVALGWLAQYGLVALLAGLMPVTLPGPGIAPALTGFGTGILVLAGYTLPPLLRLSQVSPLRVLRRELDPLPTSAWLVYGCAGTLMVLLLWLHSQDLQLTLIITVGGGLAALLLGLIGWGGLRLLGRVNGPLSWRLALNNLMRRPGAGISQLIAFSLTLAVMALILLVRADLVDSWKRALPDNAPNNFLINIQAEQVPLLERYLNENRIEYSSIYPMVRGRLSHINGVEAISLHAEESPGGHALRRELNLTFSDKLADDNRILQGQWWTPQDHGKPRVSIEQELAQELGLKLGDQLRFDFGYRSIDAEIHSTRYLDWGSMRPNFYIIFPPGGLDGLPTNYITSFHLPEERRRELVTLMEQFPTLTLLEVDQLLGNIRVIIAQVSLAVEYVLLFVLAAGFTVLFAALSSSLDERLHEGALIRTLGARSQLIQRMLAAEFILLGAMSGLIAALLVEGTRFALYRQLLDLNYRPELLLWLFTPLCGALLVGLAGHLGTRKLVKQTPLRVLREQV